MRSRKRRPVHPRLDFECMVLPLNIDSAKATNAGEQLFQMRLIGRQIEGPVAARAKLAHMAAVTWLKAIG
jgi:hypothetical protein